MDNTSDLFTIIKQIKNFVLKAEGDVASNLPDSTQSSIPSKNKQAGYIGAGGRTLGGMKTPNTLASSPHIPTAFEVCGGRDKEHPSCIYLKSGEKAPENKKVFAGPDGGKFYCIKQRGIWENASVDKVRVTTTKNRKTGDLSDRSKIGTYLISLNKALERPDEYKINWPETLIALAKTLNREGTADIFEDFSWPEKVYDVLGSSIPDLVEEETGIEAPITKKIRAHFKKINGTGNLNRMHKHYLDNGKEELHVVGDKHSDNKVQNAHKEETKEYTNLFRESTEQSAGVENKNIDVDQISAMKKINGYIDLINKKINSKPYKTANEKYYSNRFAEREKVDSLINDLVDAINNANEKLPKGSEANKEKIAKIAENFKLPKSEKTGKYLKINIDAKLTPNKTGLNYYEREVIKDSPIVYELYAKDKNGNITEAFLDDLTNNINQTLNKNIKREVIKDIALSSGKQLSGRQVNKIIQAKRIGDDAEEELKEAGKEIPIEEEENEEQAKREDEIARVSEARERREKEKRLPAKIKVKPEQKEPVVPKQEPKKGPVVPIESEEEELTGGEKLRRELARKNQPIGKQFDIKKIEILNKIESLVNSPMPSPVLPVENEINGFKVFSQFQSGANRVTLEGKNNEYKVCTNGIESTTTDDFREALAKYYSSVSRMIDTQNEDKDLGLEMFGEHVINTARKTRNLMAELDRGMEAKMLDELDYSEIAMPFDPEFILKYEPQSDVRNEYIIKSLNNGKFEVFIND